MKVITVDKLKYFKQKYDDSILSKIEKLRKDINILPPKIEKLSGDINILQKSKRIINVKYPPLGLKPCAIDGITDDTTNLNNILKSDVVKGCVIYIPSGTMILNGTITIYTDKVTIDNHALIKATLANNTSVLFKFYKSTPNDDYTQQKCIINGLNVLSTNNKGIAYEFGGNDNICRDVILTNCISNNFYYHSHFMKNSYLINFNECSLIGGTYTVYGEQDTNCGENISFTNSTLCNSTKNIYIDMSNSDFHFNSCSFDYITSKFVYLANGQIFFNDCHFEGDLEALQTPFEIKEGVAYAHMYFDNSYFLFNTNDINSYPQYIFKTNSNCTSSIRITNCVFRNALTSSDYLSIGEVIFEKCLLEPISHISNKINELRNLMYDGALSDSDLSNHKDIIVTGTVFQSSIENRNLKIYKTVEGSGNLYFLIKRHDFNSNNVFVSFNIHGNPGNSIPIWIFRCKGLKGDTVIESNQLYGKGFTLTSTDQKINCKISAYVPHNDYILVKIGLEQLAQTNTLYINDIYIDEL